MATLDVEMKTFEQHLPALLGEHRGQFVLIKDARVVDTFASLDDALKRGYEEFESAPFLVQQILEVDMPQNFTSFQLGH